MDWIQVGTLVVSGATLGKLFYDSNNSQKQLEIDRRITVIVDERRRMQRDLIDNVNLVLNLDRKIKTASFLSEERRVALSGISSYKINIWINLNRENKYSVNLRDKTDELIEQIIVFLQDSNEQTLNKYSVESIIIINSIWLLINGYVMEEETLINNLLNGS